MTATGTRQGDQDIQQLKELLSRDVKVIGPDTIIGEVEKKMRDGDFGMMPVEEDDRMFAQAHESAAIPIECAGRTDRRS